VSKDFDQTQTAPRQFKLGPLGSLNQVTKGLAKTIRAMADGTLDSQVGARICNGLGIMRACLETQKLEQLESRMDEIADRVAHERTGAARERMSANKDELWTGTDEAQRYPN
jgi:glutamate synthase domain-containing protein 2